MQNSKKHTLDEETKPSMEAFYRTHAYLVEHNDVPVRRSLMDEIDWNARLIGIKGTRGVGMRRRNLARTTENVCMST